MSGALTRFGNATLPIALAASVAVHVSTLLAPVGVPGWTRVGALPAAPAPSPVLEARLSAVAPAGGPDPSPPTQVAMPAPMSEIPPARPSFAGPSPVTSGEPNSLAWKPHILVNDRVQRARFGEALDGDVLAGFPVEIDAPVVLPARIDVPYPRDALAARKEGAVLVWATIDAQGAVETVHIVEGEPEFAAAVEAALGRTRFVPAHDLGVNIPYYITLEFEFRLDSAGAAVAAERARTSSR